MEWIRKECACYEERTCEARDCGECEVFYDYLQEFEDLITEEEE